MFKNGPSLESIILKTFYITTYLGYRIGSMIEYSLVAGLLSWQGEEGGYKSTSALSILYFILYFTHTNGLSIENEIIFLFLSSLANRYIKYIYSDHNGAVPGNLGTFLLGETAKMYSKMILGMPLLVPTNLFYSQ